MKRTGCLLFIIVLLIIGYDQWRIEQLRSEVRAISAKVHLQNKEKSGPNNDLVTALAQAQRYAENAKELIARKKPQQAQAELDKALTRLKSANDVSKDIAADAAEFLGNARDRTVRTFQKAWNDISEEAKMEKNPKQAADKR
jgi:multidrug resistance efflux pump